MNSLVASSHPLANVEQYPNGRIISFKWDSRQSAESLKKLFDVITKHQEGMEQEIVRLKNSVVDWKRELDSLSHRNVSKEIRLLERRLSTLEKSFVSNDLLGSFCESLYKFRLSDKEVDSILRDIIKGEYPNVSKDRRDAFKINNKIYGSEFRKNRHEVLSINERLDFLRENSKVHARRGELDKRIDNASARIKSLGKELVDFGVIRSAFDKFYLRWKKSLGLTYIFGLYDSEMLFQRKTKVCYNLDISYLNDVFSKVDVVTSKRFPLGKYFLIKDADVNQVLTKLLEDYAPLSEYAKLVKDFKIVVFTQQLSSVLSNIRDLGVFDVDSIRRMVLISLRADALFYSQNISRDVALSQAVSEFDAGKGVFDEVADTNYVKILSDLLTRIGVIIDFCVWLFEVDVYDDKPFGERLSAWVNDQLDKADRIEGAGGSVEQMIGGSERHRTFHKNI